MHKYFKTGFILSIIYNIILSGNVIIHAKKQN